MLARVAMWLWSLRAARTAPRSGRWRGERAVGPVLPGLSDCGRPCRWPSVCPCALLFVLVFGASYILEPRRVDWWLLPWFHTLTPIRVKARDMSVPSGFTLTHSRVVEGDLVFQAMPDDMVGGSVGLCLGRRQGCKDGVAEAQAPAGRGV